MGNPTCGSIDGLQENDSNRVQAYLLPNHMVSIIGLRESTEHSDTYALNPENELRHLSAHGSAKPSKATIL